MKRPSLYWLIIIFVLTSFLGLGLFYVYRTFINPTPTVTPTLMATPVDNLYVVIDLAFKTCAQHTSENTEEMIKLLSPFGEIIGRIYPFNHERRCLFVFNEEGAVGTAHFIVASSGSLEVATIQYKR